MGVSKTCVSLLSSRMPVWSYSYLQCTLPVLFFQRLLRIRSGTSGDSSSPNMKRMRRLSPRRGSQIRVPVLKVPGSLHSLYIPAVFPVWGPHCSPLKFCLSIEFRVKSSWCWTRCWTRGVRGFPSSKMRGLILRGWWSAASFEFQARPWAVCSAQGGRGCGIHARGVGEQS